MLMATLLGCNIRWKTNMGKSKSWSFKSSKELQTDGSQKWHLMEF